MTAGGHQSSGISGPADVSAENVDMGKIVLEGVEKNFGSVRVISDVNLTVEDGEFVVFVGPSGCGKSTLLRLIAGLEDVTAGKILIDGVDVVDDRPGEARPVDGLPVLRALPAHERAQQHRLRPEDGRAAEERNQAEGRCRRGGSQPHALSRAAAARAFRRPAPARRHRPGDRARAKGLPVRRAALQPRRGAPRPDADRDRASCRIRWRRRRSTSPTTRSRR